MKLKNIIFFIFIFVISVGIRAETKKLYGVEGASLSYRQHTNKSHTYTVKGVSYTTRTHNNAKSYVKEGMASYYASRFNGRRTSSGEAYNAEKYTAAHKTLPLHSYALVTNLRNNRKVVVRINDRGPFHSNRIIDLSKNAARELGILRAGTGHVRVEALHVDNQGKISGAGANRLLETATEEGSKMIVPSMATDVADTVDGGDSWFIRITNITSTEQVETLLRQLPFQKAKTEIQSKGRKFDIVAGPFMDKTQINQIKIKLNQLDSKRTLILYTYH